VRKNIETTCQEPEGGEKKKRRGSPFKKGRLGVVYRALRNAQYQRDRIVWQKKKKGEKASSELRALATMSSRLSGKKESREVASEGTDVEVLSIKEGTIALD